MIARLRHIISNRVPEAQKYWISMLGSHLTYGVAKVMKGLVPLWEEDEEFREIYQKVRSRILLDQARCYVLVQSARRQMNITGNIAELGSYRCGSSLLLTINDKTSSKSLHIIDSFAGLPDVSHKDPFWQKGDMGNTHFEEIQEFLSKNLTKSHYTIHKGFFPDQIDLDELKQPWSLVHIDTDLYQPTLDGLRFFYPLLSNGGMIIVDDFGNSSCPGVVSAVKEFEEESGTYSIFLVSGQAVFFKHE